MFVIPAIDILGGECVRLTEGNYDQKTTYFRDPADAARQFEDSGAEWLHMVDLDGAKTGKPVNHETVARVIAQTKMRVQVGGGIRTVLDVKQYRDLGVGRVVMGSRLAQDLEMAEALFHEFGEEVVAGIDTKNGFVALHGWTSTSQMRGTELARSLEQLGCKRVIFTDVARDGTFTGPNLEATREMVQATAMKVVASGGVSSVADVIAAQETGAEAVIVGKALYEGRFTFGELRAALA